MVQKIASSISEELPPGFPKEVLDGISTAVYIKTFEDRVPFVKTLQWHQGEFESLLQSLTRRCRRETDQNNSIHPSHKNIIIVTMPTRDVLLGHFRKT